MTILLKPVHRATSRPIRDGIYNRPVVITLAPGTSSRDDMIAMRLLGTRQQMSARVIDIYNHLALMHAEKVKKAKKEARKNGIPWAKAKKQFNASTRL